MLNRVPFCVERLSAENARLVVINAKNELFTIERILSCDLIGSFPVVLQVLLSAAVAMEMNCFYELFHWSFKYISDSCLTKVLF